VLTLNDAEERLLKLVTQKSVKGSLPFELHVRLFESPRSNCCGATTTVGGAGTTHWHVCTACHGSCDVN
jgi:hypothetical protein